MSFFFLRTNHNLSFFKNIWAAFWMASSDLSSNSLVIYINQCFNWSTEFLLFQSYTFSYKTYIWCFLQSSCSFYHIVLKFSYGSYWIPFILWSFKYVCFKVPFRMDSGFSSFSSTNTAICCMCAFSLLAMNFLMDFVIFFYKLSIVRIILNKKNESWIETLNYFTYQRK